LPEKPVRSAEILRKEGRVLEREGRYSQALRSYTRGLRFVGDAAAAEAVATRAGLFAAYGSARYRQGRLKEAVTLARRSMEEAERAGDRKALAHALRLLELCLEDLGDPDRLTYRGASLPIYEELDDQLGIADELSNLGVSLLNEGRLSEALTLFDRSRAARQRAGDVVGEAAAMLNAGEALLDQGRAADAVGLLNPALHIWRSAEHPMGVVIVLASLGRATAYLGDVDRALELIDESMEAADALGASFLASEIRVRKIEVLVVGDRNEEALLLADELVAKGKGAFTELFVIMLHRLRGWALLRLGDLDAADDAIGEAVVRARAISVGYETALALRARAEIRRRRGEEGADDDAEADGLLAALEVVAEPPLLAGGRGAAPPLAGIGA
jgi:tetratricopeptide (TPR) repeat protein